MRMSRTSFRITLLAVGIGSALSAWAQEPEEADLAKASQNPVANIISIPTEYWMYDAEVGDANVLLAKSVVPTSLGNRFNLINRFIVPYASEE